MPPPARRNRRAPSETWRSQSFCFTFSAPNDENDHGERHRRVAPRSTTRLIIAFAATIAAAAAVFIVNQRFGTASPPADPPAVVTVAHGGHLLNPSDIIEWNGRWVATRLYANDIVFADDPTFTRNVRTLPHRREHRWNAPHHLAVDSRDRLLISNGWGSNIVRIEDETGTGWTEFGDLDKPHGVCALDGWIYVADSDNSRLVRFREDGSDRQVFADRGRLVSYGREVSCADGEVMIANTYEDRPGLNRSPDDSTGNVLRIRVADWASGRADIVHRHDRVDRRRPSGTAQRPPRRRRPSHRCPVRHPRLLRWHLRRPLRGVGDGPVPSGSRPGGRQSRRHPPGGSMTRPHAGTAPPCFVRVFRGLRPEKPSQNGGGVEPERIPGRRVPHVVDGDLAPSAMSPIAVITTSRRSASMS